MRNIVNNNVKKTVVGIFAHVDAGKTTLSEAMLYESGILKTPGRVDEGNTFLDTNELEKARGITIFSKQARFKTADREFIIVDTPGHVDFCAEMERTLQVIDYGILVISGSDGIQSHTQTLWNLLKRYNIPVFIFINKMDQPGADKDRIIFELLKKFHNGIIDFSQADKNKIYEELAVLDETLMEKYLLENKISEDDIKDLIFYRKLFPCFSGSALKHTGINYFLEKFAGYVKDKNYSTDTSMRVYKISRDLNGNRLTFMKVTGGSLKVKDTVDYYNMGKDIQLVEKINQIRLYSGEKYITVNEVEAGDICCVTGLTSTYPGQGLGAVDPDIENNTPLLEPVQSYALILPEDINAMSFLPKLKEIEEEEPELHVVYNESAKEINIQIMGEVQIEILRDIIWKRFGIMVKIENGKIMYRETIGNVVEGVGHFEPLKHYAEVHVLLEPLENGSGLVFDTACSEDILDKNWQRLILTHFEEKEHKGVLLGAPITDMKITLIGGRAHKKHTEGGDFRQAAYRAIRQGLMEASGVILEPYFEFRIEVPVNYIGKIMNDLERRKAVFKTPENDGETAVIEGNGPVSEIQEYKKDFAGFTGGRGKFICTPAGYRPCHNSEEVVLREGYNPLSDMENTPDSVFCAHGAGFVVPWYDVKKYMHMECLDKDVTTEDVKGQQILEYPVKPVENKDIWIGVEEVDKIIENMSFANKKQENEGRRGYTLKKQMPVQQVVREYKKIEKKDKYLLVDGYNVIFAWKELNDIAAVNIDGARGRLMDILCNYQAMTEINLILVFDAYRVRGHQTEITDYKNIHVIYTKEAETADAYIEKFAHENGKKYDITVATSDGLEQIIIRGEGCNLISSREFEKLIQDEEKAFREKYGIM